MGYCSAAQQTFRFLRPPELSAAVRPGPAGRGHTRHSRSAIKAEHSPRLPADHPAAAGWVPGFVVRFRHKSGLSRIASRKASAAWADVPAIWRAVPWLKASTASRGFGGAGTGEKIGGLLMTLLLRTGSALARCSSLGLAGKRSSRGRQSGRRRPDRPRAAFARPKTGIAEGPRVA